MRDRLEVMPTPELLPRPVTLQNLEVVEIYPRDVTRSASQNPEQHLINVDQGICTDTIVGTDKLNICIENH
jgi:hypothetical protein